jgi:CheY-like chemotaxis protein
MRQLSILVVEDEPLIAMLLCDILVEMGHSVCALESTEKGAVAAALQHRPEMMIVDDGLLQGRGISAIAQILHSGFVPHVLVSGDSGARERLHPRTVTLRKPFREIDLVDAIQRALGAADNV